MKLSSIESLISKSNSLKREKILAHIRQPIPIKHYKILSVLISRTFSQLVYQNTNSSLQFLTATDTNRKKFLIDLLHLEQYVKLFEVFKEESRKSTINLTSIEAQIATVEKWLQDNKLTNTDVLPLEEIVIDTEEDEKELATLTIELENISEKNKKISQNNTYKDILLVWIDLQKAQSCTEIRVQAILR